MHPLFAGHGCSNLIIIDFIPRWYLESGRRLEKAGKGPKGEARVSCETRLRGKPTLFSN